MSEQKAFTVICAYKVGDEARLFYDCVDARSTHLAKVKVAPRCPVTPSDMLVFEGEMYDQHDWGEVDWEIVDDPEDIRIHRFDRLLAPVIPDPLDMDTIEQMDADKGGAMDDVTGGTPLM